MDSELKRLKAQKDATMKKAFSTLSDDKVEKDLEKVKDNYRKGPFKEYGIFQSIIEGDQAEAYKKRKAKEKENDLSSDERRSNAYTANRLGGNGPSHEINRNMSKLRDHEAKTGKDYSKGNGDYYARKAIDAMDRHDRRHSSKNESTIEFI